MTMERDRSPLDDEEPGSQGEIEAGSEGDFGDPASSPSGEDEGTSPEPPESDNDVLARLPQP